MVSRGRAIPVILDGAWGTELQGLGLAAADCPDAWNLSHPHRVEAVAAAYAEAGSQIVLTNTFRSNRIALAAYGLADRSAALNTAGVHYSRRGAAGRAKVFGSIGPSGKVLTGGGVTSSELLEAFEEQADAMAGAGVDGIVIETMSELDEAVVAIAAARKARVPVVACMAFFSGASKDCLANGDTPEKAAIELSQAGADIIGANCGRGIEAAIGICCRLRSVTSKPLWIKPNAGLPEIVDGRIAYRMSPAEFADHALELHHAGANYIGGCCGTNPEFISVLRRALRV